jgi:hypothetical protein
VAYESGRKAEGLTSMIAEDDVSRLGGHPNRLYDGLGYLEDIREQVFAYLDRFAIDRKLAQSISRRWRRRVDVSGISRRVS